MYYIFYILIPKDTCKQILFQNTYFFLFPKPLIIFKFFQKFTFDNIVPMATALLPVYSYSPMTIVVRRSSTFLKI